MPPENENPETPENVQDAKHAAAAEVLAEMKHYLRTRLRCIQNAQIRCLIVSGLESEMRALQKCVRPAFEVEIARRSIDRLEANYRVIKQGSPDLETIHTWEGIIRAANRKLTKAETELGRTPPL